MGASPVSRKPRVRGLIKKYWDYFYLDKTSHLVPNLVNLVGEELGDETWYCLLVDNCRHLDQREQERCTRM